MMLRDVVLYFFVVVGWSIAIFLTSWATLHFGRDVMNRCSASTVPSGALAFIISKRSKFAK